MTTETAATDQRRLTLERARAHLLDHWRGGGFRGELSSSALSTATAAMACALAARRDPGFAPLATAGHRWLVDHQNADGGWGDTIDSPSNISTTTICWASLSLAAESAPDAVAAVAKAEEWLRAACGGSLEPDTLARHIRARYGKDHTFSVPILTTCALAGRLGADREGWRLVPALPFELAACPQSWFRWLQLRTVSYALPALIAIGQVRHHFRPTRNPIARLLRNLTRAHTLRTLERIQPESGGFLEAAPLTSFVTMSLLAMGLDEHPVARSGLRFLRETVRDDGSWPIDTNLDTWTTTLAVGALAPAGLTALGPQRTAETRAWLLRQQYRQVHPYTNAAPGGWAWTDLSGGVPDGDDTPGALLALAHLEQTPSAECLDSAGAGLQWLYDLQNRDGGFPTFCRGWGKLPFDRSSPDLSAHCLRALSTWGPRLSGDSRWRARSARAVDYLLRTQRPDGTWVPLWFGSQQQHDEENPLQGTSRVLLAIAAHDGGDAWRAAGVRAAAWIRSIQATGGGFGADAGLTPSLEETGMAVEALAAWAEATTDGESAEAARRGADWLVQHSDAGQRFPTAPIGLYFAKLWYFERLYPVLFTVAALERVERMR